jgi:hypothetical protein
VRQHAGYAEEIAKRSQGSQELQIPTVLFYEVIGLYRRVKLERIRDAHENVLACGLPHGSRLDEDSNPLDSAGNEAIEAADDGFQCCRPILPVVAVRGIRM